MAATDLTETPAPGTEAEPAPAPIVARVEPGIARTHKALNALGQRKSDALEMARVRVLDWLWNQQTLTGQPWLHRFGLTTFRYIFALVCEWFRGRIGLQATSLVYTTLLSIIPLLALSFSLLKASGVDDTLQTTLTSILSPLGPAAGDIAAHLASFVNNVKVGVLSVLGVCTLLYTGISMVKKIEEAFSAVWQLRQAKPITSRIGQYLTLIILGPLLLVAGVSLVSGALEHAVAGRFAGFEVVAWSVFALSRLVPYLVLTVIFFVLYKMIPQTYVKARPALQAAGATALMWQMNSLGFGYFVGISTSYNAIYSSFAVPLFTLIWLYVSWMIVLLGSQLAYYFQYPEAARHAGEDENIHDDHEFWVLWLGASITRRFVEGAPPSHLRRMAGDPGRADEPVPVGGERARRWRAGHGNRRRAPPGAAARPPRRPAVGYLGDGARARFPTPPRAIRWPTACGPNWVSCRPPPSHALIARFSSFANEGESVAAPAPPPSTFQRFFGRAERAAPDLAERGGQPDRRQSPGRPAGGRSATGSSAGDGAGRRRAYNRPKGRPLRARRDLEVTPLSDPDPERDPG